MSTTESPSDNPLLVAPRSRVVELYGGDFEVRIGEALTRMQSAFLREKSEHRMGVDLAAEAEEAAAEHDRLVEEAKATAKRVTLTAPPLPVTKQLRDDHPPDKANKADVEAGVRQETYLPVLVRACVGDQVTDEQFEEFLEQTTEINFQKLADHAWDLVNTDVKLPKSSAVSLLARMREVGSRPQPVTESVLDAMTGGSPQSDTSS